MGETKIVEVPSKAFDGACKVSKKVKDYMDQNYPEWNILSISRNTKNDGIGLLVVIEKDEKKFINEIIEIDIGILTVGSSAIIKKIEQYMEVNFPEWSVLSTVMFYKYVLVVIKAQLEK